MVPMDRNSKNEDFFHVTTDGLAVRAGLWSVQAPTGSHLQAQLSELKSCGLVGQQLVDRQLQMHTDGWLFEAVPSRDYVAHNPSIKMLTYLDDREVRLAQVLGVRVQDATKTGATFLAHELAHHDQVPRYPVLPGETGAETMAKRLVLSEARSYWTEAHVAQSLFLSDERTTEIVSALKERRLGSFVIQTHQYPSFGAILADEADDVFNAHHADYFG